MAVCSFAAATGYDAAALTNIEDLISVPPHVLPAELASALGGVRTKLLSKRVRRDGDATFKWVFDVLSMSDFQTLIIFLFGDFSTASAPLTVQTLNETNRYARYNAIAERPYPNDGYTVAIGGAYVVDVVIPFTIIASLGEFSLEFSEEFNI